MQKLAFNTTLRAGQYAPQTPYINVQAWYKSLTANGTFTVNDALNSAAQYKVNYRDAMAYLRWWLPRGNIAIAD